MDLGFARKIAGIEDLYQIIEAEKKAKEDTKDKEDDKKDEKSDKKDDKKPEWLINAEKKAEKKEEKKDDKKDKDDDEKKDDKKTNEMDLGFCRRIAGIQDLYKIVEGEDDDAPAHKANEKELFDAAIKNSRAIMKMCSERVSEKETSPEHKKQYQAMHDLHKKFLEELVRFLLFRWPPILEMDLSFCRRIAGIQDVYKIVEEDDATPAHKANEKELFDAAIKNSRAVLKMCSERFSEKETSPEHKKQYQAMHDMHKKSIEAMADHLKSYTKE